MCVWKMWGSHMLEGPFKNSPSSTPCAKWNCYGPLSSSLWATTFFLSSISDSRVNNGRTDVCVLGTHTSPSLVLSNDSHWRKKETWKSLLSNRWCCFPSFFHKGEQSKLKERTFLPFTIFHCPFMSVFLTRPPRFLPSCRTTPVVLDVCCLSKKCEGRARKTHWRVKFSNFSRWKKWLALHLTFFPSLDLIPPLDSLHPLLLSVWCKDVSSSSERKKKKTWMSKNSCLKGFLIEEHHHHQEQQVVPEVQVKSFNNREREREDYTTKW